MTQALIHFLSNFSFFENDKNLFLYIENYIASQFLVRPILVYSTQNKNKNIELTKCRNVIGKNDRLKLYSLTLIEKLFISRNDLKEIPCLSVKVDNCYYFYLNLGLKKNQFHFAIFSGHQDISIDALKVLSRFASNQLQVIQKFEDLYKTHELIHIDDVTGLYNQRKLHKDLSMLVEKYQKERDPFSILFIDIDYFKKINDSYGHLIGTKLLENVALTMKSLLRDSDISYRYGGDEFVVVLVNSDAESGKIVGERILQTIKQKDFLIEYKNEKKKIQLSVSIGVAEFPADAMTSQEILSIADRMMYEAKESGRGIVFNTQDIFRNSLAKAVKKNDEDNT